MMPNRVAYVVNVFPKLSETFIAGELAELRRRGVELRVLSLQRPRESLRHAIVARAELDKVTCYEPAEFPAVLRDFEPQLFHAHFATEPTAAARQLANESARPFTFTAHGYDIRRKPPPDFAERAAAAQAVVTVSNANAHWIAGTFGVPLERIHVIPCGVDTDQFRPAADRAPAGARASGAAVPLIVCVARHVRVKNLVLLLEACALLQQGATPFRCVMVGDGPLRGELEEMCERLGLRTCTQFTGALDQSEVLKWWQRATVAVLTSEDEGMPVCLMEAAACGVPAVATAVGGVPELVRDGETGLLAPPGDAEGLASALAGLLADPQLAARLGTAARQRAEAQFSLHRHVASLLSLWSRVLEEDRWQ
jgi:glycosyltransferase involved in cell wall biosynthesis